MAKIKKAFKFARIATRGEEESLWTNKLGEQCWLKTVSSPEHLIAEGYEQPVVASDMLKIRLRLFQLIEQGNTAELIKLLKGDFIYPEVDEIDVTKADVIRFTRPIIETLFFEYSDAFLKLIDLLLKCNQDFLYRAVFDCLKNADIPHENLFAWNVGMRDAALAEVQQFNLYGLTLATKSSEDAKRKSGLIASSLQDEKNNIPLQQKIAEHPLETKRDSFQTSFHHLQFKLSLMKSVHAHDEQYAGHRGWKRFTANFFSILFTVGVLNFINRCVTGNWRFYNKTTTQHKVKNVDAALGLDLEEKICFGKKK